MNKLIVKKILGFKDPVQTFVINAKQSDTNREIFIQIVDELTLADFSEVTSAYLHYIYLKNEKENIIDLSSTTDKDNSSVTLLLTKEILSMDGTILCEIVLKDNDNNIIITTNTFMIKVNNIGGGYS